MQGKAQWLNEIKTEFIITIIKINIILIISCCVLLALTKDVDLTISNLLDGRTTYDSSSDVNAADTTTVSSTDKPSSSLAVCLPAISAFQLDIRIAGLQYKPSPFTG